MKEWNLHICYIRRKEINMKKILKKSIIPFIILFISMVIIHLLFKINWGDDVWFKSIADQGIIDYIGNRYSTWSSRIIIETIMIFLLQLPSFIWAILDSLIITILAYSISYLFTNKKSNWIVIFLVLLYPLNEMNSAGWYATTMNYLWPLALGLFSFIPIKNFVDNKKEKKYMYPLYLLSLLYACNQEQMCAIIFCFYLIFIIYLYMNKRFSKFILIQFIISVISIIFILTCPGNDVRTLSEINTWYPAYENFGLLPKAFLGMFSTIIIYIFNFNIPMLILSIILPILVFRKKKQLIYKIASLIPIVMIISMNFCTDFISKVYPGLITILNNIKMYAGTIDKVSICPTALAALLICLLFIISILISLFGLFEKEKRYLVVLIFLAGLSSRFIMGFSPTIFASGMRTFIFLNFSIIIILILLVLENKKHIKINLLYTILLLLSAFQIANTVILSIN